VKQRRALFRASELPDQVGGRAVVGHLGFGGLVSSPMIFCARTLPSSTPHWSKESMFQMAPWVKTECS